MFDDDPSKPLVSIALATYNGRTYLPELLASLEAQSWPNLEVVVSDDASSDGTPELLAAYAGRVPVRLVGDGTRAGIVGNFERALAGCRGEYVALADQDDVWAPEKITDLMRELQSVESARGNAMPVLAFCDIELVDSTLCCLSRSLFDVTAKSRGAGRLRDFLLSNHVPGCAMLVNRATLERALPFPAGIVMHDWWLAMVVASFGEMRHVAAPHLKYRQHDGNAVGASATNQREARDECAAEAAQRRGASRRRQIDGIADQVRVFAQRFGAELPADARDDMHAFSRGVACWRGAFEFVMISHTGESFIRAVKMLRRLRANVLSFGVETRRPSFSSRLRQRRGAPRSIS
ncbi:glycosyltransferase family 2 protein [Paraburkholderia antibiotica]|uniref:Glycosyltransferase family 2 protein n=1 Tax=Paraburkholderia antibiotica TaxID=2728839 RepID=A0A7X9ZYE6_9BURK|nr:glycosyltransferase family 2 protein [Paraburkholderia antibiotica]NML33037.1 glycosyltransferase family 2 protein [Paraburkholderia antibiotica]